MRIVGAVYFEQCLPEHFNVVNVTTSRMALADSLENDRDVTSYCARYLDVLEPLIEKMENYHGLHLKQQPMFEWMSTDKSVMSPCWQWEHAMVLRALYESHFSAGLASMGAEEFKDSRKSFLAAKEVCERALSGPIRKWTFNDMPTIACTLPDYWFDTIERCQTMAYVSSLQFALATKGDSARNNVLSVIAKKIEASSSKCLHRYKEAEHAFDCARIMRGYLLATSRWSQNNYPDALALMEWRIVPKPPLDVFPIVQSWFVEKEEEFDTWERDNKNIYFATATPTMPSIDD